MGIVASIVKVLMIAFLDCVLHTQVSVCQLLSTAISASLGLTYNVIYMRACSVTSVVSESWLPHGL